MDSVQTTEPNGELLPCTPPLREAALRGKATGRLFSPSDVRNVTPDVRDRPPLRSHRRQRESSDRCQEGLIGRVRALRSVLKDESTFLQAVERRSAQHRGQRRGML